MKRFADWLSVPPTVMMTGCIPEGTFCGITKLTCVVPTRPGGIPSKAIAAATPPTVTVSGRPDCGRKSTGVPENGDAPVASGDVTTPSPVRNSDTVSPGLPLELGTRLPEPSVKMPGAEGATVNTVDATFPLLLIPNTAGPAPVS